MTVSNNPYDILGIKRNATPEQIKAAWKKVARQNHPDHGGKTDEFIRMKQAAMVLLDPAKRKRFDDDGIADENRPDNTYALAMERLAGFFINSIDATLDSPMGMRDLDFVAGAKLFVDQQIQGNLKQIADLQRRLHQYDNVVKRIKTKQSKNAINEMILAHMRNLKQHVEHNKKQVMIGQRAKEILADYEFEVESPSSFWRGQR